MELGGMLSNVNNIISSPSGYEMGYSTDSVSGVNHMIQSQNTSAINGSMQNWGIDAASPSDPRCYTNIIRLANVLDVSDITVYRASNSEILEFISDNTDLMVRAIAKLSRVASNIASKVLANSEVAKLGGDVILGSKNIIDFQLRNAHLNRIVKEVSGDPVLNTTFYFLAEDMDSIMKELEEIKPALAYIRDDATNFSIGLALLANMDNAAV